MAGPDRLGQGWRVKLGEREGHPIMALSEMKADTAISDPLAHLRAEHARQRDICDRLDDLIAKMDIGALTPEVADILTFLNQDLAWHIADEEHDLFPTLGERCTKSDRFPALLRQLQHEHEMDIDLVDFLRDDLEVLAGGSTLANPTRLLINLREFTATQRRHLEWEDTAVLPLADARLTDADRDILAARMRARRGA
jgi:hemerythrin-like domain-containing protein